MRIDTNENFFMRNSISVIQMAVSNPLSPDLAEQVGGFAIVTGKLILS
jgi:hypothetical protein